MIYVTGDTHGLQRKWTEQIEPVLRAGDTVIVCGDFGVGFWGGCCPSDEAFLDRMAGQDYTVLFVDGNHENFTRLEQYPVERWQGGCVHRLCPNLIHLMRGEVYRIGGSTLFAFGGGYSLDRCLRQEGVSWWPQEMPSEEEYANAEQNLGAADWQVDYIITHTLPSESAAYLASMHRRTIKSAVPEEWPLNAFLDGIQNRTDYKHWYCGHFHADNELWRGQTVLFNTIRELESGKIVRQWEPYEG